eukprot:CAMPEP_0196587874 /NCGR_PEP_ID=MMETSP1081-20130531/58874_1 /TAXON_ID=36882 /ORGANISM="Pyramimonas amylifera, Strain CCMP720" /LENGTH=432 /DNA_ID=CAMNT_0041910197 /DNA_START=162 /DNA_END=1460 /DNA_ORIENTATION=+
MTQARVALLRTHKKNSNVTEIVDRIWHKQHTESGKAMYELCINLKGFYIKAGQFIGCKVDLVPQQVCESLSRLQDKVPAMKPEMVRQIIETEFSPRTLKDLFQEIDLESTLGSASIAQVHRGRLRTPHQENDGKGQEIAVKVQFPDAERKMRADFWNLRKLAAILEKYDLPVQLSGAIDELEGQVKLEFDFRNEAKFMDAISDNLKSMKRQVCIPRSVPGLVTKRVLVMDYLEGVQLAELSRLTQAYSERARKAAARRILTRLSKAYGRMMLVDGVFQADGHPGNILVMKNGTVGLLDYGQSKVLTEDQRLAFARMVCALNDKKDEDVLTAMDMMGVLTKNPHQASRLKHASNMFDTLGSLDAFSAESVLKLNPITRFPTDYFLVVRVIQLLRALAHNMEVDDFSCVHQWQGYAGTAIKNAKRGQSVDIKGI